MRIMNWQSKCPGWIFWFGLRMFIKFQSIIWSEGRKIGKYTDEKEASRRAGGFFMISMLNHETYVSEYISPHRSHFQKNTL